jgi:hypothetical protein
MELKTNTTLEIYQLLENPDSEIHLYPEHKWLSVESMIKKLEELKKGYSTITEYPEITEAKIEVVDEIIRRLNNA